MREYNLLTKNGDTINKTRAESIEAAIFFFRKVKNLSEKEFHKLRSDKDDIEYKIVIRWLDNRIKEIHFKDSGAIRELFKTILGSDVTIKDNLKGTEETVFCLFISKLDESRVKEDMIFDEAGIDLKKVTDPLWLVIENMMRMLYGEEATEMIMWYLFERFDSNGKLLELFDEVTKKKYKIKTPKDLFAFIKHRFPKS